jgi:hypothetical protein
MSGTGNGTGVEASASIIHDMGGTTPTGTIPRSAGAGGIITTPGGIDFVLEAWQVPASYTNSWVDVGGNYPFGYMKDPLGFVHFKGAIKNGTIGLSCFTLPEGYRPGIAKFFAVASNSAFGEVSISSGGVTIPAVGSNAWVSFEGITYLAGS